jgi:hypothetical protein
LPTCSCGGSVCWSRSSFCAHRTRDSKRRRDRTHCGDSCRRRSFKLRGLLILRRERAENQASGSCSWSMRRHVSTLLPSVVVCVLSVTSCSLPSYNSPFAMFRVFLVASAVLLVSLVTVSASRVPVPSSHQVTDDTLPQFNVTAYGAKGERTHTNTEP